MCRGGALPSGTPCLLGSGAADMATAEKFAHWCARATCFVQGKYDDLDADSGIHLTRDEEQAARLCKQLDFLVLTATTSGARVILA